MSRLCSIEGCERQHCALGLCTWHYAQDRNVNGRPCEIEDCQRGLYARGLCKRHYHQARRRDNNGRLCTLEGCERPLWARGWCNVHYLRAHHNGGDPGPGDRLPPIDHAAFSKADAQTWYWVGFLAADGCVSDQGDIYLRLAQRDREHLEHLRAFVGAGAVGRNAGRISGPHKGSFCLTFRSRPIAADLLRLGGITPRKTLTYDPGPRAAAEPAFWLGLLDGDGTAYWHNSTRWKTRRAELIWCGSSKAMAACAAFWRCALADEGIRPPRQLPGGNLWEMRLTMAGQRAPTAARLLLEASGYSLPRKRRTLQAFADQ